MLHSTFKPSVLETFRSALYGTLIVPGDANYEGARRVWNGMIDKHPSLIVRCANSADVISAVKFAREQELAVSVRGGGHSAAGKALCDRGLVIDLSAMKGIQVDPIKRTARAEAGLTLGDFISATRDYGLATTTGVVSDTGLAGLMLGGGVGWLMGKYGLTIDNLLSVDIVTAQGELLTASPTQHEDLFWGIRGGGGNFGVVTTFELQLHAIGPVLGGMILHPISKAKEVLRFYRDYTMNAHDELTVNAAFVTSSDGHPVIALVMCYCGSLEEGERIIEPVRSFGPPLVDLIHPMDYLELITLLDAGSLVGLSYYEEGLALNKLSDEMVDVIVEYSSRCTSPLTQVLIQHIHGAACRVDPAATAAYALRSEQYDLAIVSAWDGGEVDQAKRHIQWTRAFWEAMEPMAMKGLYVNFLNDDGEDRIRAAYGTNYERLVALKNTYDPVNFFRFNHNIKPTVNM